MTVDKSQLPELQIFFFRDTCDNDIKRESSYSSPCFCHSEPFMNAERSQGF